jgi:NitT/TauT family transport system permease protein
LPGVRTALERIWGEAALALDRSRRLRWVDAFLLLGFAGLVFGIFRISEEWTAPARPAVEIDLSPRALPLYALFSLSRGLIAYLLSLTFTLAYGYWAAKDRIARPVLLGLLDVLQSIPILGFMPGLVLVLVSLFPRSNVGLELASILLIFTGQAWNMTFSFYHSVRAVPQDLEAAAVTFRFSAWQRLKWLELPSAAIGLVWNSMMSMAGGWFFLMLSEAFVLGRHDFRLPGLGSYMSVAVARGDVRAMIWAVVAMAALILILDQLLWRPLVAWTQKFRSEETSQGAAASSWFYTWLRRSLVLRRLTHALSRRPATAPAGRALAPAPPRAAGAIRGGRLLARTLFVALLGLFLWGGVMLVLIVRQTPAGAWPAIVGAALLTLLRVLAATGIGTLWALPVGLAIGLSPRLSRGLQPVIQLLASFPAPMLFPAAIAVLDGLHVPLGFGSIVLMLLGTQWYILFNVIAGAMALPADLREAAGSYRLRGWARFWGLHVPGVFPFLVTGWITAAGGAWNASVVSEYVMFRGRVLAAPGIGSEISRAAERGDFPALAAGVLVMAALVVLFNRTVWHRCARLAEERYALQR